MEKKINMRMRKKKHSAERIANCSEYLIKEPLSCRGNEKEIFGDDRPLLLEIGCGKGDFSVGLSSQKPEYGIIAMERVPDVAMFALEKAAATAGTRPDNLRYIIGNAEYINDWFSDDTFSRIYVNFCDPWPKTGYFKRRLTAPGFLERYRKLLVKGGELHFKTDNEPLFDWSVEQFRAAGLETLFITRDLHSEASVTDNIVTEYESRFVSMGMPIFSAHVRFNSKEPAVYPEKKKTEAAEKDEEAE